MAEPTVQVPVSLIERIVGTDSRRTLDKSYAIRELRALLSQLSPTAADGPMPVSLLVSPGDLETSADAVRRVMREHDPGQLNGDEVAWLDTSARRLDQAAELIRQTFDRRTCEPPSIADMAPGMHVPDELIADVQESIDLGGDARDIARSAVKSLTDQGVLND